MAKFSRRSSYACRMRKCAEHEEELLTPAYVSAVWYSKIDDVVENR